MGSFSNIGKKKKPSISGYNNLAINWGFCWILLSHWNIYFGTINTLLRCIINSLFIYEY